MVVVDSLSKRFGRLEVLRGVSAEFRPGLVTAVVGPNAAGKTTLLKCVLGLVRPDSGTVTIGGRLVDGDPAVRARVGYMPQEARFPDNLRVRELLELVQDLRGERSPALDELVDLFDLREHLGKPLRALSGGTRQKASAALTFAFAPRVLVLDEPSAGLDPVASSRLKDRILLERERGATVLLTSHVMSELEELADEVLFLLDGSVRYRGALDSLRASTGEPRLERALARLMGGGAAVSTSGPGRVDPRAGQPEEAVA